MKFTKVLSTLAIGLTLTLAACGPKDADIKVKAEEALKGAAISAMVDVKEGVATLTGELKDEASKASLEGLLKGIKGVKSVVNNCSVAPAPAPAPVEVPASVNTTLDAATQQKVKDGLKDLAGVSVSFEGNKAVLSGAVSKEDRMKIMQMLASAKVKSDVSKLTNK
jgi:hyperosmotically inducible periplasmic protein